MDKYDKRGKFFLVFSIFICALMTYMTVKFGFTKQNVFVVSILFLIFVINSYIAIKNRKIYYAIGDILMGITVFIVFVVPYLIGMV